MGYIASNPAWTGINYWDADPPPGRCRAVCRDPGGCGWPVGYPFNIVIPAACADHNPDENRGSPRACVGNPVHPGAGNKFQRELDYVGSGPFPLRYERVYNSLGGSRHSDGHEAHGPGWWTSYRRAVVVDRSAANPYRVYVTRPDGTAITFTASTLTGPFAPAAPHHPDELRRLVDSGGDPTGWSFRSVDEDLIETFDARGDLLTITNRQGLTHTLTYHPVAAGQTFLPKLLASVADPLGRQLVFTYDGLRRLQTMTAPGKQDYQYSYDPQAANRLLSVTYPDGRARTYISNEPANTSGVDLAVLTGVVDENGIRYATWSYDTEGRVIRSEHAGGVDRTTVQYMGPTQSTVSDAFGVARTYQFSNIGGALRNTSISGSACAGCEAATNTYDLNGFLASRTDWNGNKTCLTHDARGLEVERVEGLPAGATCPFGGTLLADARRITTEWHPFYRLPARIAEPLRITSYVYGEPTDPAPGNRGSVLSKTAQATSDATGAQGFSATPVGTPRVWTYTRNATGQVLTMDGPRTDGADVTTYTYYPNDDPDLGKRGNLATITNALGHLTRITAYNAHGQPLTTIDPNDLLTVLLYDPRQRLTSRTVGAETTSYAYDGVGQLERLTSPDGSFLDYDYDAAHRLFEIRDNLGNRIHYTLDLMGNRTQEQVFDPAGTLRARRAREYDALNRLVKDIGGTDPLAQVTQYGYDDQGNRTSIDGPLSGTPNDSTVLAYDPLNRLRQVTDALSGVTRFGYDGLDQLASVTDPRNNATSYTVSGLGDQTQEVSPDRGPTQATFDAAGNVITRTDARGKTTTFSYDALNRVTSMTFNDSTPALFFTYDNTSRSPGGRGRLHRGRDALGNETTFSWTQEGRLLSRVQRSATGVSLTARWAYDAAGRMVSLQYPSGKVVSWGYDAAGRPNQLSLGSQQILSASTYFPFGGPEAGQWGNGRSRLRMHDLDGRVSTHDLDDGQRTLDYDVASRVEGFLHDTQPALDQTMGHDELDRLTDWSGRGQTRGYDYDANGNRTSLSVTGTPFPYLVAANSNRLLSTAGPGPARTFTYDEAGNVVSDGTSTFTYDARGRLVRSQRGGQTHGYVLNGLGERVAKSGPLVPSGLNHLFYDEGGRLLGEYGASGVPIQEYVWWGEEPVAVLKDDAIYFVDPDHLGTPVRLRDAAGEVVWRWDGIPFAENAPGEIPSGGRAFVFNLRLPGQYFDRETGLHYNYFRDYDPATGRYVQVDPIGLAGGMNTYVYGDDPLSQVDPEGLMGRAPGTFGRPAAVAGNASTLSAPVATPPSCNGRWIRVRWVRGFVFILTLNCTCYWSCYSCPGGPGDAHPFPNPGQYQTDGKIVFSAKSGKDFSPKRGDECLCPEPGSRTACNPCR